MKLLLIGVAVVAIALLLSFLKQKTQGTPREFKTTDEIVQWLANEAVKDAREHNQVTLDYSPESIKQVEAILGQIHDQYTKDPSSVAVTGLASAYGAYIGEVIRRSEPAVHWEKDDPDFGEKTYPLFWGKTRSYPMAWCQKRIINGDEDNVWFKYKVFKEQANGKPPTNPKR